MNKNFAAIWANLAAEFPSANTEMVATPLDLEEATTTAATTYPSLPRHQVLCQPEPGQPSTLWTHTLLYPLTNPFSSSHSIKYNPNPMIFHSYLC